MDIEQAQREIFHEITVWPLRLRLRPQSFDFDLPRIRGVWGRALHGVDDQAYQIVFKPPGDRDLPRYVIRPVEPWTDEFIQLDCILIGDGVRHRQACSRAWDVASGMGLGKQRAPFRITERTPLGADASPSRATEPWPLSQATAPTLLPPADAPCQLRFRTPVCLLHKKRLIERPTLTDVAAKACRRLGEYLPPPVRDRWDQVKAELIARSKTHPCGPWQARGEQATPQGLARYSAAQDRDFHVPSVSGRLPLPAGAGPFRMLFTALQWLHVGKSTIVGLGWPELKRADL